MPYSPYEWNESINQRNDYIEERLKEGSPVVGISYDNGLLLLSLRRSQRKIYEIYDRLIFSAIGNQSDIETIRTGAIDIAHREGFTRSPDDVSIQRIVGFAVSPSIKKVYSDPFGAPVVLRAVFAELGKKIEDDQFMVVSYDGEFTSNRKLAVLAGTAYAEMKMRDHLQSETERGTPDLAVALRAAIYAWGLGRLQNDREGEDVDDTAPAERNERSVTEFLTNSFDEGWTIEAGILERNTLRESRFRMLRPDELEEAASRYKKSPLD
jgi:proteasome alpha subunit